MKKFGVLTLAIVCSLFFVVYLVGCGTSGSDATTTTTSTTTTTTIAGGSQYFPRVDGYIWTYDYITGGETGSMVISFEGTYDVGTLETQIRKQNAVHPSYPSTAEIYLIVTDDAALVYGTSSSPTTECQTYLPFPLSVGESWSYQLLNLIAYCSIVSYESVTVPAGTFDDCYEVYTTYESGSSVDVYEWYAPDVGLVKNNNVSINTGLITATFELTSKNF